MPEFYIHCGLHKTGTTSLQHMMKDNAPKLFETGLYYPTTGTRWGSAHHNLAWELTRDRRFTRSVGQFGDLLLHLPGTRRDTVISSEDFETALLRPDLWKGLVSRLQALGYDVTFVVYLRDPLTYLESLYSENVKHGCPDEFGVVARSVVESRQYRYKDWVFCFDYDAIGRQLGQLDGVRVAFRSYERLSGGSSITDFFELIGHDLPEGVPATGGQFGNNRASPQELLKEFIRARREPTHFHTECLPEVADLMVGDRTVVLRTPRQLADVIRQRTRSQIKMRLDAELPAPELKKALPEDAWVVNVSRFYSWETHVTALDFCDRAPGTGRDKIEALRSGDQGMFDEWRKWVSGGL